MPLEQLGAAERIRRLHNKTLAVFRTANPTVPQIGPGGQSLDRATLLSIQLGGAPYTRQNASGSLTDVPCCPAACLSDTSVIWGESGALSESFDGVRYSYSVPVAQIASCLPVQAIVDQITECLIRDPVDPSGGCGQWEVQMDRVGGSWTYRLVSTDAGVRLSGSYTQGIGFQFVMPNGSFRTVFNVFSFTLPPV
jgi:hypothetical protein